MKNTYPDNYGSYEDSQTVIEALPANFLGVEQEMLQPTSDRTRSMSDLGMALTAFNESGMAVHTTASIVRCHPETPDVARHINRGVALTWALLQDAAPDATQPRSLTAPSHEWTPPTQDVVNLRRGYEDTH